MVAHEYGVLCALRFGLQHSAVCAVALKVLFCGGNTVPGNTVPVVGLIPVAIIVHCARMLSAAVSCTTACYANHHVFAGCTSCICLRIMLQKQ